MSTTRANITASILLALLLLIGIFIPLSSNVEGQEIAPMELNPTHLYFAEGMEMTPLTPESTDEYQAVTIPNGFIRDGFRGLSILPVGHTYWKSVGTWYTQPLKKRINLGGKAEVTVYAFKEESDGGSPSSDFTFEILRGEQVLLSIYVPNIRITEGQDIKIVGSGSFPPGNDTTIEPGMSLSLRITARCNGGGAVLKFGSKTYDSGVTFGSNALEIHDVKIDKHHVILEYKDAFMAPWTKLYKMLLLNGVIIPNDDVSSEMNAANMTRELHWERRNGPGDYELLVSIGYSPEQNISRQAFLKITDAKTAWFKFSNIGAMVSNNIPVLALIIIMLAAVAMYGRHRGRVWDRRIRRLPPEVARKQRGEAKRYWKEMRKKKREEWKKERKKRIIEDDEIDEEMEEEEFRIFKRKVKKAGGRISTKDLLEEDDLDMDL